jgi:Amt family ammonium transporter
VWGLPAAPITTAEATLAVQAIGLGSILGWVFVTSFIVWLAIRLTFGIRVSEEEEYEGVDIGECGLEAYPEFVGPRGAAR